MPKATLLFNQNAIKSVQLSENFMEVFYADGNEPVMIQGDDELWDVHYKNFRSHVDKALDPPKEEATEPVE